MLVFWIYWKPSSPIGDQLNKNFAKYICLIKQNKPIHISGLPSYFIQIAAGKNFAKHTLKVDMVASFQPKQRLHKYSLLEQKAIVEEHLESGTCLAPLKWIVFVSRTSISTAVSSSVQKGY